MEAFYPARPHDDSAFHDERSVVSVVGVLLLGVVFVGRDGNGLVRLHANRK